MSPTTFSLLFLLLSLPLSSTAAAAAGKPDCPTKCGNITVPYPFGIGLNSGCSIDTLFSLTCDDSFTPPKLSIKDLEILDIQNDTVLIKNTVASHCYSQSGTLTSNTTASLDLTKTPFSVSDANMITLVGCDEMFLMMGSIGREFSSGCISQCSSADDLVEGECSGVGCAQSNIPRGFKMFVSVIMSLNGHVNISAFNPCGYAFLGDPERFVFRGSDLTDPGFLDRTRENVPMILDWEIGDENCSAVVGSGDFACSGKSVCVDSGTGLGGYRCGCVEGYEGNPYLSPGCTGNFSFSLFG